MGLVMSSTIMYKIELGAAVQGRPTSNGMKSRKKNICVVTGTRADYGLLLGLLREIRGDNSFKLQLIITGTHLEKRFGYTYAQIIKDGFVADATIRMHLTSDTDAHIVMGVGQELIGLSRAFKKLNPDIVVVLGDRFEMLAVASAALLFRIPIAHIHGGEVTYGAYDDAIRHAITKMASLHFTAHKEYTRRIIQMGEDPRRVFTVGSPALEAMKRLKLLTKPEIEAIIGFPVDDATALVTFHPVTNEKGAAHKQIKALLRALGRSGMRMVFTFPNADAEHEIIILEIRKFAKKHPSRVRIVVSLGHVRYFSLMKYAGAMVGNSSSGIFEAPSFKLPVVNIGTRQEGRVRARNVIDCGNEERSILNAIHRVRSPRFKKFLAGMNNPFNGGNTSAHIINEIKVFLGQPMRVKRFIDRT